MLTSSLNSRDNNHPRSSHCRCHCGGRFAIPLEQILHFSSTTFKTLLYRLTIILMPARQLIIIMLHPVATFAMATTICCHRVTSSQPAATATVVCPIALKCFPSSVALSVPREVFPIASHRSMPCQQHTEHRRRREVEPSDFVFFCF